MVRELLSAFSPLIITQQNEQAEPFVIGNGQESLGKKKLKHDVCRRAQITGM